MADDRTLQEMAAFERFWDALATGRAARTPGELDPEMAAIARRLQALPRPAPVEPSFESKLWEELMQTPRSGALALARPSIRPRLNDPIFVPHPAIKSRQRTKSHRIASGLSFATAIALIAAMLAMIFFIYQDGRNHAIVPPLQATPVATPEPGQPTGWLQFRGNAAHTGIATGSGPAGDPVLLWKAHPTGETGIDTIGDPPAIADGVMYIGTGHGLLAIDIMTGKELWRAEGYGGGPAIDGDGLIARTETGSSDGLDLVRLRRADGSLVWRAEVGLQRSTWYPTIVDGVIYIPSGPNDLIAVDAATGAVKWRAELDAPAARSAAVGDGVAYVGTESGTLSAIETKSGDALWTANTPGVTLGMPTVTNGAVYLSTKDGASNTYYVLDAATGAIKWTYVTPSGSGFYYAAVDATTVYLPSTDGIVYALDAATGALRWRFPTNGELLAMPVLAGDTLYQAGTDGFVYAIDAVSGKERWRFAIDGRSLFSPIVVDGVVYLSTEVGTIYAIGGSESNPAAADASPGASTPVAGGVAPVTDATTAQFLWAAGGSDKQQLYHPSVIRLSPDSKLWVTSMTGEIFIFDLDGNLLETWGSRGSGPGQFKFSNGTDDLGTLTFAPDGSFYVADAFNYRIQHFDRDRTLINMWGSLGDGDGQFRAPVYVAIESDGNVLVTDLYRADVQRFAPDGTFLGKFDGSGTPEGKFNWPTGLVVDQNGRIYVVELNGNRVRMFTKDWTEIGLLGAGGPDFGGFNYPADIVIDGDGYIYVADQNNNRIVVFDRDGRFVFQWGEFGSGDGQFSGPDSIAPNRGGTVYIADWHNNRIQKFKLSGPFPVPAAATPVP